jgi:hypothetical protein
MFSAGRPTISLKALMKDGLPGPTAMMSTPALSNWLLTCKHKALYNTCKRTNFVSSNSLLSCNEEMPFCRFAYISRLVVSPKGLVGTGPRGAHERDFPHQDMHSGSTRDEMKSIPHLSQCDERGDTRISVHVSGEHDHGLPIRRNPRRIARLLCEKGPLLSSLVLDSQRLP